MGFIKILMVFGILLVPLVFNVNTIGAVDVTGLPPCDFPAIYNFGDSNSDTGNLQSVYAAYPKNSAGLFGRFSDGRILLDFIAEKLKLQYVSAYLNPIGTNFRHGVNFATSGASITASGSLFNLDVQIIQFDQVKARTISYLYKKGKKKNKRRVPNPEDFSKALYTFDIGENDFIDAYSKGISNVRALLPDLVNHLAATIKHLYKQGARAFWIHNTAPLGCYDIAMYLVKKPTIPKTRDQDGCYTYLNEMATEFNSKLKDKVSKLRVELPEAALTYVDVYTLMHELSTNHKKLGIRNVFTESVHRTTAANQWLAHVLLNGSFSDPPVPITHACHKHAGADTAVVNT